MLTVTQCEQIIKSFLTKERFYHSCCVSKEAGVLARRFGADAEKAEIAGMLHDIMKDTGPNKQLKIMERFGIILSNIEKQKPKLWHAISGTAYIEHELGVQDPDILSAVRWHTTGRKDMTLLDKVIFIADFNSADRDYDGVWEMRRLAKTSLERTMIEGIVFTANEQFEKKLLLGTDMIDAYNDAVCVVYGNETER